jgi:hypothetical protein
MQLVDADASVVVRYWPAANDEHATVPVATAYCPVAQPMQLIETDAPVVVRYCVARPIPPSAGMQVDWE